MNSRPRISPADTTRFGAPGHAERLARSPHFDGRRFSLSQGAGPKGLGEVLRWMTTRRRERWPDWVDNPDPHPVAERVTGDALRVTFINHASWLVQLAGINLLLDPVWAERVSPLSFAGPRRARAPGLALDALPPIDAVLVSHNHYDHLDLATLKWLWQRHRMPVVAPLNNGRTLCRVHRDLPIHELDWYEALTLGDHLRIEQVPTLHWSNRAMIGVNRAQWGGYVISHAAGHVYFCGDSGFGDGKLFAGLRERFGGFRLALLPIGAYEPRWFMAAQHMDPDDAVRAHALLDAHYSAAMHFGTFQLTDEGIDAPVQALASARDRHAVDARRFRVLAHGEAWDVPSVAPA